MIQRIKIRTFEILEVAAAGDLSSRIFDVFIMTLISLNVLAVIMETVESFSSGYVKFFKIFEIFSVLVFTVEYALRIWSCTVNEKFRNPVSGRIRFIITPFAIIDLMAILPFYLPMIIPLDLRFVRALRLFRLFRLFKMGRYSESLKTLGDVLKVKKEELIITIFIILILLVLASSLMFFAEHDAQPKKFSSIPAAMWWGVATLSTVGYGDLCPLTPLGKILGGLITVLGIGMFALPAGILASGFSEVIQRNRGKRNICPHCGKDIDKSTESS